MGISDQPTFYFIAGPDLVQGVI